MAKTKKVIALVLAFMMIFSSVSVLATAFNPVTDGGSTLTVSAQIFKNDGTEWVACDKVTAGEPVKVRVSIGTDYYSNSASLIFFYDNSFFSDSYSTDVLPLTVNDSDFSGSSFTTASSGVINRLFNAGCVTTDYLNSHNYFVVYLEGPFTNYQYDDSDWLFEFDLTVKSDASGDGVFEVLDSTVKKTTNPDGYFDVPKGPQGGDSSNIYDMGDWFSGTVDCSVDVTTASKITLNPAGGEWQDEHTTVSRTFNGTTGAAFARPELAYTGKTLAGWYDSSIASPALTDLIYGPEGPTAYSADEDIEVTAYWIDQVGATFSYNYDGAPADVVDTTATPGYPVGLDLNGNSIVPAVPTREGYQFRGWSTDAAASPQSANLLQNFDGMVYGNEGVAYYMIWAKAVTVDFYDTKAGQSLGSFSGYAGDPFTATVPTATTYTGYSNIAGEGNFIPAAPSVFPESDTTYNAIYEANSYIVNYIIYSAQGSYSVVYSFSRDTAYGETVITDIRYTAPSGKQLNAWYTDQACSTAFTGGTLTSTSGLTLYGYLEDITYTVTFDLNGGNINGDTSAVTSQVALGGTITAPADPEKDGFVFAGWTPSIIGSEVLDTPDARTYYATWDLDPNLVEYFYYEDGTTYEEISNTEGDAFVLPADPYKYGYSFVGWSAAQGSDVVATLPATMPDASTYYYAIFTPNTYDVTFDADGGEFADNSTVTTVPSVFDSAIVTPADPTRTGYEFQGWALTSGGTVIDDLDDLSVETSEDEPLVYYAVWEVQSYPLSITYVMSDGNNTVKPADVVNQMVVYGENYDVPSPTVTGYTPDIAAVTGTMDENGYSTTVTYSPNQYALNITYVMSDGNDAVKPADVVNQMVTFNTDYSVVSPAVTGYTPDIATVSGTMDDVNGKSVTVTYSPVEYTLTINYVMSDGMSELAPAAYVNEHVAYNTAYNVDSPDVTGYTPDIATVSGTMDDVNGKTITVTYTPNEYTLTVTYVMSDGTTPPPAYVDEHVVFNTEYTVASPAVTGYTPDIATVTGTMDDANGKTVTVTYTPNRHKVTWVVDDQQTPVYYNFGEQIVVPDSPTKYGYTFVRWAPDVAATMGDEDLIYNAIWQAKRFNVIFILMLGHFFGSDDEVVEEEYEFGEHIVQDEVPILDGYVFNGWATSPDGAPLTDLGDLDQEGDVEFYATWVPAGTNYVTEYYYMDTTGSYPATPKYSNTIAAVTDETVYAVTDGEYAETGFTLDDEYEDSVLLGTVPATGTLTLKVYYSRDQHEATFIDRGTEVKGGANDPYLVYYGATPEAPTVERTGYTFEGWATTENGEPAAIAAMGTDDVVYYAIWTARNDITITVHEKYINLLNNTETVTDKTFTGTADAHAYIVESAGADATAKYILFSELDQVLATNYAIDPTNANNVLDGAIAADGSLELTVWYAPVSKTVTYNPNGGNFAPGTPDVDGEGNLIETYTYYDAVTATSLVPAREGYDFLGWNRSASATVPNFTGIAHINADTVVYAVWSEYKTVTVNYVMSDGNDTVKPATFTQGFANGAAYNVESPTVTGYSPDKAAVTGTMGDLNVIETVTYTPNQYPLNITYVMSDGNNDVKPADVVNQMVTYNTAYSVDSPTVLGYTASIATVSGTMDENGYSATVTYTPKSCTLKVTYVMSDNSTPPAAHIETVTFNTAYSVPSPTVTGYTPNMAVVEGTMDAEGKEITVTYTLNVAGLTINYIYTDGTEAAPTYTEELHYGDNYNVASPAITGYTPDKAAVTGTMGNDPVVETVIYTVNTYELRITYVMADGTTAPAEYVAQVAYQDNYSVDSPAVAGYTPDVATVSGTMGTQAVSVTVTYTKDAVTVKFVIPARITGETNYGKLDYPDAATVTGTEINVGSPITAPSADDTAITYYNFLGWTTTPITGVTAGNPDATLATIGNAEDNVVYYAVYDRDLVYLVSRDTTKATIDRMGNNPGDWTNLYTEATFDSSLAQYKTQRSYSLWVVHHPAGLRITSRTNPYTDTYYDIHGDGELVLTKSTYYTGNANIYGTGSKMTIRDKVTGQTVEQFYIVIFGDTNGDNAANNSDVLDVYNASKSSTSWAKRNYYDPIKFMAANLAAPATFAVNNSDYLALYNVYRNSATYILDPATGVITEVQAQDP